MTDPSGTDLDARYGRRPRGRRPLLYVLAGVLVVVALGWLVRVAVIQATPPVSSRLLAFAIPSDTSATATIQVERRRSVEASCRLQAKAADFAIVGELTVTVPADSPRRQTVPATLTTQRAATSVVLIGCTTPDSKRPH
ncbi:uncharacterized protein DUF4307 [Kribbella amoyensis]|uniref:Uncharacterized protein DUF4307 n=1 Tax=Kribbella amoyensis TaxID=996641 RepID=A0A561B3F6_9ACTN|nr:DUF4307 domain-containing protein [Kribbella amoyensis]TWD73395.1 uncharacterized protein DUF4307 [Kribbella amoyensis]